MDRVTRANLLPALEVLVVVVATGLTVYFGIRYDVATILENASKQARLGLDVADFGPGLLVLSAALGVMSVRRWREAVGERRTLSQTRDVLADSEERYRSLVEVSPAPIVLTDATGAITFANAAAFRLLREPITGSLEGRTFAPFIHPDSLPLVMERNTRLLRGERIAPAEVRLMRADGTDVVVQLLSAPATIDGVPGVQSVLQDVTHLTEVADTLRRATIDTVEAMARLAEARDPYTAGHQSRVAKLGVLMAQQMGLPDETVQAVRIAGIVHDIGKINVPVEILSKPGKLSETEFDLIKEHSERGYEILRPISFPWLIADIVRQHHERLDGTGYPHQISGDAMLIESRILAVADVVEAVASNRPYRPALGLDAALRIVGEGRGTTFDAACVDACAAVAHEVIT